VAPRCSVPQDAGELVAPHGPKQLENPAVQTRFISGYKRLQRHATPRNATQRHATPRNATRHNATQRNATQQQRQPVIKVDGRNAPREPSDALDRPLDLALAQRLAPLALAVLVIANLRAQTAAACAREQRLGTTMSAFWPRTAHGDHTHPSIAQGPNTQ
jgi:hypothetical protein